MHVCITLVKLIRICAWTLVTDMKLQWDVIILHKNICLVSRSYLSLMRDVTVGPGSQLEWMDSDCCCNFSVSCSLVIVGYRYRTSSVSKGRNLPSEAHCKNKHSLDVKPQGRIVCQIHLMVPNSFCINPQPPKKLKSLVVTFFPCRNKIKYGGSFWDWCGIWNCI